MRCARDAASAVRGGRFGIAESRLASGILRRTFGLRAAMETAVKIWTDEELMALPRDGFKRELLNGEIIMSTAGSEHGRISFLVAAAVDRHAGRHGLGLVFDSSTGFASRRTICSPRMRRLSSKPAWLV